MSKFIDKLKGLTKESAPAIGFRSAAAGPKPPPLLVITRPTTLSRDISVTLGNNASAGVDASIVPAKGTTIGDLKALIKAMGEVPLGLSIEGVDGTRVAEFAREGFDFVTFGTGTAIPALEAGDIGRVLEVTHQTSPEQIRALPEVESVIDAVYVSGLKDSFISIEHLLMFRRLVRTLSKPLVVEIPGGVTTADLKCLWDAGVDGIVLTGSLTGTNLQKLKDTVAALPRGAKRQWGKSSDKATPRIGGLAGHTPESEGHEHEEEEEEE